MSKINELIDRLIAIKDQLNNQYNKDTINEVCGILAKVERGELVEVVTCEHCINHVDMNYHFCRKLRIECPNDSDFYCKYGERSVENNDCEIC